MWRLVLRCWPRPGARRGRLGSARQAESALAAAKPRSAPETTPAARRGPRGRTGSANKARRLDQTVDYDAACLDGVRPVRGRPVKQWMRACILSLVTEENDDDIDLPDDAEDWGCEQIVTFMKSRDFCPHIDPASHSATLLCSVWASCAQAVDTDGTPAPAAVPKDVAPQECDVPHPAWVGRWEVRPRRLLQHRGV